MISEADDAQETSDDRTTLVWSLLVSGFFNLMVWMLISWGLFSHLHAIVKQHEEPFMVVSSSLRIEQKNRPVPQQPQQQPQPQQQQQQPEHEKAQHPTKQPQAQPTEIARLQPQAPPQPRSAPKRSQGTLAEQLAQQEAAFAHEAQQINAAHGPISVATIDPSQRQSATKSFQMNFSGVPGLEGKGEGFLTPLQRWIGGDGRHCYYGRYNWIYPTGGTEIANIPWPFCFPPTDDPIARGLREFPFPLPLTGYRLPPNTYLYPIEKEVYEGWLSAQ
jgi:hypothetical protein